MDMSSESNILILGRILRPGALAFSCVDRKEECTYSAIATYIQLDAEILALGNHNYLFIVVHCILHKCILVVHSRGIGSPPGLVR